MIIEELIKNNEAPSWMQKESFETLSKGYLLENETPREMYRRVAKSAAINLGIPEMEEKFFDYMWKNWLCPASPILSNSGTERGLPISCFVSSPDDSILGIMETATETAVMTKHGGGVGITVSGIRARGSDIGNQNGKTEGIIPFLKIYDSMIIGISQGGTRKGSASINLDIEHGDFDEFIAMRRPEGDVNRQCQNLNHCVTISDEFMKKIEDGDKEARRRWTELMRTRFETGEPYIFWKDTVNNANPQAYFNNNKIVNGTNLCCLTGDSLVLTKEKPIQIKDLVGKTATIWDGKNWVENSNFKKYGKGQVIRITLSNGAYIDSTYNHRWFVSNNYEQIRKGKYTEVFTDSLSVGQFLESHDRVRNNQEPKNKQHSKDTEWRKIIKIEKLNELVDVYCTTVPSTKKFALANGLMTGNSEIVIAHDEENSTVCCLSSLNAALYDEWKDSDLPQTAIYFLDGIMSEFISKASLIKGMEKAVTGARRGRPLGLGILGWHTLLQRKNLPFESFRTMQLNNEVWRTIKEKSLIATKELAEKFGEPEWCRGLGVRNTHLLAQAPTRSNSIISGYVSAGIEPIIANIYKDGTAKGTFLVKNKELMKLLDQKGKNTDDVWNLILKNNGSVQSLDFLTEDEKKVYLTAFEINQMSIIQQAAQRQKYICQSQSVNLFFPFDVKPKFFNDVHLESWKLGLKTLYYCRTSSAIKAAQNANSACVSCEG